MRIQYGAVPVAVHDGELMIMLVTSRGAGRWIIPKGRPEKGVAPHKLAAREAFEEAGLLGQIDRRPLGRYRDLKRRADGNAIEYEIEVFRLDVLRELSEWPEKGQRERRWYSLDEAVARAEPDGLANILADLRTCLEHEAALSTSRAPSAAA
ncbi:MAG TPA: NUDIX hydrolase [Geminicoccus sp.]|uniref:NUDIX hydrolase n=1 Tax=Geminicoccus sp. TaxID=2024832 RepID=UPI002D09E957|nr:NUDIX hydrolase [Geminicoccus sp.]HWL71832.1 NUDIX hydrolase [Geminicoccus sp.]